jgi:osmotically-inducible protein OsmY
MGTPINDTSDVQSGDDDLLRRVKLSLYAKRAELASLLVRADGGIIRLSGFVSSFYVRQLAVSAVTHVAGVRRVVDEIAVPVLQERKPR